MALLRRPITTQTANPVIGYAFSMSNSNMPCISTTLPEDKTATFLNCFTNVKQSHVKKSLPSYSQSAENTQLGKKKMEWRKKIFA